MPYNINRKTIIEINVDGPERVDPEWVERREVWKDPYEKLDAILEREQWRKRIQWALKGEVYGQALDEVLPHCVDASSQHKGQQLA